MRIKINEAEHKVSKNGKPYMRFKVGDKEWLSCFEEAEAKKLKEAVGKTVDCDVVERDGGWKNITRFNEVVEEDTVEFIMRGKCNFA